MTELTYDAIVIGAGLSGLQAALDLHAAGKTFIVLEARDRVGGKTYSVQRPDGKGVQELGAAWLNDTNQSHIWKYCQQFNLTPVIQKIDGMVVCEDRGGQCHTFPFGQLPKFDDSDVVEITTLRDNVEAASLCQENFVQSRRAELDKSTLEEWCKQYVSGTQALLTVTLWCRGTLGQDPSSVSALAFLEIARGGLGIINLRYDGKDGAQHLRLVEGTQSIATGMARLLPEGVIRLKHPITAVKRDEGDQYTVTSSTGRSFRGSSVVISIPSLAYKNIAFDPPISSQRQEYLNAARYGTFIKYICLFKNPFWRNRGCCGLGQSFEGPINHCRDTSVDAGQNYALTCFITSNFGQDWLALSLEQKQETILGQLSRMFAIEPFAVAAEFLGSLESDWTNDEWAGYGCPFATVPPGVIGDMDESWIDEAAHGLFFVGTELTNEWRGYMEGALRSGKRGAAQASAYLRKRCAASDGAETPILY